MKQRTQKQKNEMPKKKRPVFSFVKGILRLFYRKPKIVYLGGETEQPAIILSNHVSLKGPLMHELHFPVSTIKWGAGEMLGNYKTRFNYLRNVFYMQKRGFGKVRATLFAIFSATFSKFFYRGMNVVPTWHDARMFNTVNYSVDVLNEGGSVLIFPENSDEGYKDVLTEFHAGFVTLAECYYKKTGKDVPVHPVYYHRKKKIMAIGEPIYVQDYVKKGLNRAQIAEEFRKIVNNLYIILCGRKVGC